MNYGRSRLVALSFLALSVASGVYVSVASVNYLGFYPALNQIQVQLVKLQFLQNQNVSRSTLTAFATVGNPTGYSGFRIGQVIVTVTLYQAADRNNTLFSPPDDLSQAEQVLTSLPPNSVRTVSVPIDLNSAQANATANFVGQNMGQVDAEVTLNVYILTFLESVTGAVPYTVVQDLSLSYN